jgi:predicted GNAT family acetyltransferase
MEKIQMHGLQEIVAMNEAATNAVNDDISHTVGESGVVHNLSDAEYTMPTEHGTAELAYIGGKHVRTFIHTGVPYADRGKGIASKLVQAALIDTLNEQMAIHAVCPYVRWWLSTHPDFVANFKLKNW